MSINSSCRGTWINYFLKFRKFDLFTSFLSNFSTWIFFNTVDRRIILASSFLILVKFFQFKYSWGFLFSWIKDTVIFRFIRFFRSSFSCCSLLPCCSFKTIQRFRWFIHFFPILDSFHFRFYLRFWLIMNFFFLNIDFIVIVKFEWSWVSLNKLFGIFWHSRALIHHLVDCLIEIIDFLCQCYRYIFIKSCIELPLEQEG